MKIKDIVAKTDKELTTLLGDTQKKLAELHVDYKIKQVSNIKEISAVRRQVAQIKTIQRERAITASEVNVAEETK